MRYAHKHTHTHHPTKKHAQILTGETIAKYNGGYGKKRRGFVYQRWGKENTGWVRGSAETYDFESTCWKAACDEQIGAATRREKVAEKHSEPQGGCCIDLRTSL